MADKYLSTYSSPLFENGELGPNEYAIGAVRFGVQRYWVRADENEKRSQNMIGYIRSTTDQNDIRGKKLVAMVGEAYYSEFEDDSGKLVRVASSREKMDRLRTVKGEPVPTRDFPAAPNGQVP